VIAGGLLVYSVPEVDLAWVAQCTTPRTPLTPAQIAAGTGGANLRTVSFDCAQTWLYPGGGTEAGLYALHLEQMMDKRACIPLFGPCSWEPADTLIAAHLGPSRLSYEQPQTEETPPSVLFEWTAGAVTAPTVPAVYAPDLVDSPGEWMEDEPLEARPSLAGRVMLIGAEVHRRPGEVVAETWWLVRQGPISRPFSIMGQLLSEDGEVLALYDNLGVSPLALVPGDIVVQRHTFETYRDEGAFWLLTGAYWLDTMERWPLAGRADVDTLAVPIVLKE
jgi:hypothetical protein